MFILGLLVNRWVFVKFVLIVLFVKLGDGVFIDWSKFFEGV